VDELEPLAAADEHHGVLARVVAAAQRLDADRSGRRAPTSPARSRHDRLRDVASLRDRVGEPQRGAARRVALRGVMQLDDLRVEVGPSRCGGLAHQPDERVHREREVGRAHDRDRAPSASNASACAGENPVAPLT
jgi:hypothetical protein